MRKRFTLWVLAACLIFPSVVFAKYVMVPKNEVVSASEISTVTEVSRFLSFVGEVPAKYEPSIGMGRNVPLYVALEQISPAGWKVFFSDGDFVFDNDFPVTWFGAKKWTDTIGKVMESVKGHATVNWITKQIEIKIRETVKQQKMAKPMVVLSWNVKASDQTIAGTLNRWAEESKTKGSEAWTVLWESPKDCLVDAEAIFTGDFRSAVRQVVVGLRGTEAPVEAVWHSNNVVRIVPMGSRIK